MYHLNGTIKPIIWYTMLTKKQLTLLKPFQGANIVREYGVRELARASNEKSNNAIQLALKQFIKEKIVSERKVGTSKLYKINLSNNLSYNYLELIKFEGLPKEVVSSVESLMNEIDKYSLFYSLAIFGSYAIEKQAKNSDLDIAVFIPNKSYEQNVKIASNMAQSSALLPLHVQIVAVDDFFEMLINKQANVGKEIARKHRVIYNLPVFYKIIKKALSHGFQF